MGQSQTDRATDLSLALAGCELLFTSFCSPKERTRITVLTSEHYCENYTVSGCSELSGSK